MRFDFKHLDFIELDIEPNKLAISGSDRDLSWSELKTEVDKLKSELIALNLPEGHPVVIYGHKEVKFIVSIIACMSLNHPYIPVDNIFPESRLLKIKDIIQSSLIINTSSNELSTFPENIHTKLYRHDDPIIYVMFTSGSTGEPKGVQITQEAILSYTDWILKDFPFTEQDIFLNQIPFSFDLSTYELFSFLTLGASIVSFSRTNIDNSEQFIKRLSKYQCTVWNSTPSFLRLTMMMTNFNGAYLSHLKKFFLAGEQMSHQVASRLFNLFCDIDLYNSYGPTEGCNTSTLVKITQETLEKYKILPVGYPKYSTEISLLNKELDGNKEIGEIVLTGDNISIGYFNNEELNSQKFTTRNGSRSFKTGDYGYFEDGMLFFVGRRDDLVKLHGFRVEIDEIDNVLKSITAIDESITITLKRRGEIVKLISFIVSTDPTIDIQLLKNEAANLLPYYMIPSDIIQIEELPYNVNHKVDRKALIEMYKNL